MKSKHMFSDPYGSHLMPLLTEVNAVTSQTRIMRIILLYAKWGIFKVLLEFCIRCYDLL